MMWDPFEEIERLKRRMERLAEIFERPWVWREMESFPIDLAETKDEIIVRADLPGFSKDEIEVKVDERYLEIRARKKEEKVEKKERIFRAERRVGKLKRGISLPEEIIPEETKAKLENGVLEIRLKKVKKKTEPRKVEIE